jgi:hypothetical protein
VQAVDAAFDSSFADVTTKTHPSGAVRRVIDHVLVSGVASSSATTIDLGHCGATHRDDGRCSDHQVLVASVVLG